MTKATDPTPNQPGGDAPPTERNLPVPSEPLLDPSADVLLRYNARVLDPTIALQLAGQTRLRPTVFITDRLIVSGAADGSTQAALEQAAAKFGLRIVLDDPSLTMRSRAAAARAGFALGRLPIRVRLVAATTDPTPAPDAWNVLQTFRGLIGPGAPGQKQVALDHLLTASRHTSGSPFVPRGGYDGTIPSGSYGLPGWGGRQPVNWVGAAPVRNDRGTDRRPVVAVLDTGVAEHDWLPPQIVRDGPHVLNAPADDGGVTLDPYEGTLDQDFGHGTFIAGLIRQECGDADILSLTVMSGDGVVAEGVLLDALYLLLLRQQAAIAANDCAEIIDVVSLSLGYYHEQPDDITFDPELLKPLRALGELGVATVAAAGNDSTDRPMFPAAFTPWSGGPVVAPAPDCVPVVSVGALNPNGTIALFSNAGEWVACHHPGVSVVSTYPKINASQQASYTVTVAGDGVRSSLDPDDFTCGFAVWSGTSFAGPVLAGRLAAQLCQDDLSDLDAAAALARGWAAVTACVDRLHP